MQFLKYLSNLENWAFIFFFENLRGYGRVLGTKSIELNDLPYDFSSFTFFLASTFYFSTISLGSSYVIGSATVLITSYLGASSSLSTKGVASFFPLLKVALHSSFEFFLGGTRKFTFLHGLEESDYLTYLQLNVLNCLTMTLYYIFQGSGSSFILFNELNHQTFQG